MPLLYRLEQRPISHATTLLLLILVSCFSTTTTKCQDDQHHPQFNDHARPSESTLTPKSNAANIKYLVPYLHIGHYQYWLKSQPKTRAEFAKICAQLGDPMSSLDASRSNQIGTNIIYDFPPFLKQPWKTQFAQILPSYICSKMNEVEKSCWGYEKNCEHIYLMPECHGSSLGQAKDEQDHKIQWFNQADFGYVLERRRELSRFCLPDKKVNSSGVSSLDCIRNFKSCWGENLRIKFDNVPLERSLTTSDETYVLKPGNIGGWNCDLQLKRIQEESGHLGKLQSWYRELENYNLNSGLEVDKACDIIVDKQAFFVKLDSPSNIYHYLNSALNFYLTMHLNNKFFSDNQIIIWDGQLPFSRFTSIWSAFSHNPVSSLADYNGKRVCFKRFVFVMPPRTLGGLYYNTPLVPGCTKTGLFDAFNKHILIRLGITPYPLMNSIQDDTVNVIMLSRSTKSRRILNQDDLRRAVNITGVQIRIFDYDEMEFHKSIQFSQNSDVLVGMHGAGLTNTLFQPDWGALFELYDCGDKTYHDLARLRGVRYHTIVDRDGKFITKFPGEQSDGLNNDKFFNYRFDIGEFVRSMRTIVDKVRIDRKKYFERQFETRATSSSQPPTSSPSSSTPILASSDDITTTTSPLSPTFGGGTISSTTLAPPLDSVTTSTGTLVPVSERVTTISTTLAPVRGVPKDEL